MSREYFGPRRLTREEKRRYGSMPSTEIQAALRTMFGNGTQLCIVNQVRSILAHRLKYERALASTQQGRAAQ